MLGFCFLQVPVGVLAEAQQAQNLTMRELGAGRYTYRLIFKLYDAVLYVEAGGDADAVLAREVPFRLEFTYHREIQKNLIIESADHMLSKNLTHAERQRIASRVERLNAAYRTVQAGDRSSLTYLPGVGTQLRINGRLVESIPGEDFARLYFRIWLGAQPISERLKAELLGR